MPKQKKEEEEAATVAANAGLVFPPSADLSL